MINFPGVLVKSSLYFINNSVIFLLLLRQSKKIIVETNSSVIQYHQQISRTSLYNQTEKSGQDKNMENIMKKSRRKPGKRNGRFHKSLFAGILLLILMGAGVLFTWKYIWKNPELREKESFLTGTGLRRTGVTQTGQDTGSRQPDQESKSSESAEEELLEQKIEAILTKMTLDEKICQLFILTPEQLTGISKVTAAGEATRNKLEQYPIGGLIYFAANLTSPEQTKEMLRNTKAYGEEIEGLPLFLCIDEEGGRVARIGKNPVFSVEQVGPMSRLTTEEEAYRAGKAIGAYLYDLGFNTDFAPDADVLTNEKNTVISDRSFGSDPERVTHMAAAVTNGLHAENILSAFKHFPGHGATEGDTHEGYAYTEKTYEELRAAELVPFAAAEECGVDMVMAAHISLPNVVGDSTPSSLSHKMITEILRGELGYQGLIVTDAMNMGAIAENYGSGEAAVKAVEAGVDLLMMPKNFQEAFQGIQDAVSGGRITEERIEESLRRILHIKLLME